MVISLLLTIFVGAAAVWVQYGGRNVISKSVCGMAAKSCQGVLFENQPRIQKEPASSEDLQSTESSIKTVSFPDDVVALTEKLVSIPSASGSEHAAGRYIASWLRERGWQVSTPAAEDVDTEPRFNVLALPPDLPGRSDVRVVLSTHFDTVPAGAGLPRLEGNRLYGRGAVDAKGIVASMMIAGQTIAETSRSAPLALLFVCGEETDHAGMIAANELGLPENVSFVNGEPTTGKLCINQKGILKLTLTAHGVACHSGYPELGTSAIEILLDGLARLRDQHWPVHEVSGGETTMNIGVISGGSAANVVPPSSTAVISFRIVSDVNQVMDQVHDALRGLPNVTATFAGKGNPPQIHYAPPRALAAFGTYTAAYNTDLSYFNEASKKVLFGGGTIANAHTEDEYIDLADLRAMPHQYDAIVRELFEEQAVE